MISLTIYSNDIGRHNHFCWLLWQEEEEEDAEAEEVQSVEDEISAAKSGSDDENDDDDDDDAEEKEDKRKEAAGVLIAGHCEYLSILYGFVNVLHLSSSCDVRIRSFAV